MIPTERDVELVRGATMLLSGLGAARELLPELSHLADRMAEETAGPFTLGDRVDSETVAKEFGYIHERIDQLIRQCALEIGILDVERRTRESGLGAGADRRFSEHCMDLVKNRLWAADDAAAEKCHKTPRER